MPIQESTNYVPTGRNNLKLIPVLVLSGALASLVCLSLIYVAKTQVQIPTSATTIYVSALQENRAFLYGVDEKSKVLNAISLTFEGKDLKVNSEARSTAGEKFYLAYDTADSTISNLYVVSSGGVVKKLTNSNTTKYHLTYSEAKGVLAYQTDTTHKAPVTSEEGWNISVYSLPDGTESVLAKGRSPIFVQQGTLLVYESDHFLKADPYPMQIAKSLLPLHDTLYAVDAIGNELVLWNESTQKIDYFSIQNPGTLSYVKSVDTSAKPSEVALTNGVLYQLTNLVIGEKHSFIISDFNGAKNVVVPVEQRVSSLIPDYLQIYE